VNRDCLLFATPSGLKLSQVHKGAGGNRTESIAGRGNSLLDGFNSEDPVRKVGLKGVTGGVGGGKGKSCKQKARAEGPSCTCRLQALHGNLNPRRQEFGVEGPGFRPCHFTEGAENQPQAAVWAPALFLWGGGASHC